MFQTVFLSLILSSPFPVEAREFRDLRPIPTRQKLPEGALPVEEPVSVEPETLKNAVKELAASWNSPDFEAKLSSQFYDKQRLLDSMSEKVPRDAQVRILGVGNIQVIQQYRQPEPGGGPGEILVSTVTVTAQTQIEFNDPSRGFQRINGTNQLILQVEAEIVREP
ncbi:MAG: hypothetical protein HYU36_09325 [Planctomycetes bacterium]|nr:hypothetical protein [Planctomycetota bacterium]